MLRPMNVAGHKQRPPLHVLEKSLLAVFCAHLIFLPWAFGTMHAWSQSVSAAFALIEIVLALWPRSYRDEFAPAGGFEMKTWPRLVRFPPFWLGLGLLGYLVIQWLNPAWEFRSSAKSWWMEGIPHNEWLPTSTRTPFERYNLWRSFLIYGSAWLSVCALWIGMTRRKSLQILSGVLIGNAVILAIVGFAHRLSGETKVLWIRAFKDNSPFSSFIYQNHGGAYFSLVAAVGLALVVWHFFEGRKRMARSTPAAVWGILSAILVFAVLFSFSRGAVITATVFAVSAVAAFAVIRAANPVPSTTPRLVSVMLVLAFVAAAVFILRYVDFSMLEHRFREMATLKANDPSVRSRVIARDASWDMFQHYWLWGAGAGNFQYLFSIFISRYPEEWQNGSIFWPHAHIDWLEIPIELGVPGVLLIASAFGWACLRFFRWRAWQHPVAAMVFLGCMQTLLHAAIDFPFQNPAVLSTWWVVLFLALRWVEIDRLAAEAKAIKR